MAQTFGAAIRNLRRAPAFIGLVVLTLALGIGATTAMFSVVDAVLINPLPFPNADRVLEIWTYFEAGAARSPGAISTIARTIREQDDLFEAVSAYQFGAGTLTGSGDPEMVSFAGLSPSMFSIFPAAPIAGRLFTPGDATSSERVILMSERLWTRRFGRDPAVLERTLTIDDQPYRVIGILPSRFNFPESSVDAWRPIDVDNRARSRVQLVVMRRPDVAKAVIDDRLKPPLGAALTMRDQVGEALARPRFVLSLSAAFTICAVLIAAVGVYGVSAYWVARRRRELAIRLAMGASPDRLVRSVLARSLKLTAIGTIAGIAIALGGAQVLRSLLFATDPRDPATFIGVPIVLGLVAIAACAGPAFRAARVDPMTILRAE